MSNWEERTRECLESADKVANTIQKDDIVIFLWSWYPTPRRELFNLLAGTTHDLIWSKFVPQKVRHSTSGAQILFVAMPNLDSYFKPQVKQGLQRILSQMDKAGAKFSTYIWVHDIRADWSLTNGIRYGWNSMKEIFEGDVKVEMDNVTFLSTCWDKVDLEKGQKQEQRIREVLRSDMERGLAFGQLPWMDKDEAWCFVHEITALTRASLDGKAEDRSKRLGMITDHILERRIKRDAEERKKAEEDSRVIYLQNELGELYAELDKTEYGRGIRAKFWRADDDQKRILEPLLAQADKEGLKPTEKERLERMIEEEYILCLREFRGHFAEVRAMGIVVGYNLREFYGLSEPMKKKKRFGRF
ncbi:hypothetical protein D9756_006905 [Leucocoprinus leucothites]|uniref:Uncharacterized protein n=1 Tax=Leucocoprinus leucothites TaxID=201217 RepID=A0A8H5D7N0_9AGAR|nr:hypothetical protein D9756_006905 [Leucoagaricus leucothites]